MRILSIFGSPRRNGCTNAIHDSFLEAFAEGFIIRRVYAYEAKIHPCTACSLCDDSLACVFKDDMTGLYEELLSSDMITVSSPLYFSSLTGPLKNFIDRCQAIWAYSNRGETIRKKTGFFISAGGSNYAGMFDPAVSIMRYFFNTVGGVTNENDYLLFPDIDYTSASGLPKDIIIQAREAGIKYRSRLKG
jgi:multimeric flavodoxin WrbA